tara:strand:- start:266 stop:463 length:198 start_codon:yes stop_codon:yes gene_type:complete
LEESNEKKKSFDKTREEQKKIQKSIVARRIKFDFFGSVICWKKMDGIERIFGYFGKNLKGSEREK